MAVAYAKLYELIYKNVKDEKKAEELYKAVEEFIKQNEIILTNPNAIELIKLLFNLK